MPPAPSSDFLASYSSVLIFLVVIVGFLVFNLFFWWLIRPSRFSEEKLTTYECGENPTGSAWVQFNIRFYVIALIFIIFDVEVAFILPCAVVFKDWVLHDRGMTAFLEIAIFVVILLAGLAYVWAKGDLNWVKAISEAPTEETAESRRARIA